MNSSERGSEFLPKEVVLKLHQLPDKNVEAKIELIESFTKSKKHLFDPVFFESRINLEIGYVYWKAQDYVNTIAYLEKVIELIQVEEFPFFYFNTTGLLIRCYRLTKNYYKAAELLEVALSKLAENGSFNDKLNILGEYFDYLDENNLDFDAHNESLLRQLYEELEVVDPLDDPKVSFRHIQTLNKRWNIELSEILITYQKSELDLIKALETYQKQVESGWHKRYAANQIKMLKKKLGD